MLGACQGEYPIAATRCDDWCRVTEPPECEFTSPSICVRECENHGFVSHCPAEFDAALACFEQNAGYVPSCLLIFPDSDRLCRAEQEAFANCAYSSSRDLP